MFGGGRDNTRGMRTGCLRVQTSAKRRRTGRLAGRWRRRTSNGSCCHEKDMGRDTWRLQRSRFKSERWSWRSTFLTEKVQNILFGLFPLHSVRCGLSAVRGTWRVTEKKMKVEEWGEEAKCAFLGFKKSVKKGF